MNPYYQDELVTIYHGDSKELIHQLEWDVTISDFPYAVGENYETYHDGTEELKTLISKLAPVFHKQAAITTGTKNQWIYPRPSWTLAWVCQAGTGMNPWGFSCWQPILVYGKCPYLSDGKGSRPDIIVSNERSYDNGHPCPKPIGVWKWIVKRVSKPEWTILDPCMGSGTTLRVAKDFNQKAIGVEIEEKYCEIAARRLDQQVLKF